MKLRIACKDSNYYFRLGIAEIIREAGFFNFEIEFLEDIEGEKLNQADFIIINVSQWRLFMCQPAFRYRKAGCVLLVFMEDCNELNVDVLPRCYQSLTLFKRSDCTQAIREKIWQLLCNDEREDTKKYVSSDCDKCSFNRISLVQLQVISLLKKGKSVREIAEGLELSIKTIYAHKYSVMKKYDLKGECDLHAFLNDLSLIEIYKGVVNTKCLSR